MKTYFYPILLIIFLSIPAFAARPLVTDDFGTLDAGKYEFEFGYNSITPKTGSGTTSGLVAQLKRGFTQSFDLGLELPYSMTTSSGLGDAVLHAKLKLKEFGEDEGITARVDIKLSNGDAVRGLGSGFLDYGFMMILSKKLAGMNTHFNTGYVVVGDPANSSCDDTLVYGAAFKRSLTGVTEIAVEYTCISCQLRNTGNLQIGGGWQAFEAVRFDAGYSIAMNDNSNNVVTAGLTAEF